MKNNKTKHYALFPGFVVGDLTVLIFLKYTKPQRFLEYLRVK